MSIQRPRSRMLSRFLFAAVLGVTCVSVLYWVTQQIKPWVVPAEYKTLRNPLVQSESSLSSASEIYRENCVQCHGQTGKGDGPEAWMHRPAPADLTDPVRMANVTDGEMFYQITEGRRPMPAFKSRLTIDQRWQLVLYLKSFSQLVPADPKK